jgi:CARDB protein
VPPDDFFDEDWEEPSRTQDTAITRPAGDGEERTRGGAPDAEPGARPRQPRPGQRRRPPRPGRRPPQMPKLPKLPGLPGGGGAASLPALEYRRLAGLAVGILLVIIILVLLARSCSGSSAKGSNEDYVATLTQSVLKPSDNVARGFHQTFDLRSASLSQMQGRIDDQLASMRKVRATAAALKPTKQLEPYQAALLQALQLRVTGLTCFSQNIRIAWKLQHAKASGTQLYQCMGQLLSSDYLYADFYADGANTALKKLGAPGVPTSQFLRTGDLDLVTPLGIGEAIKALHPGAVHGLHGTQVVSVVATPQNKTLEPGPQNKVVGNNQLEFVATVKNSGNFTEVGVNVQLKLKLVGGGGKKFTQTKTISRIAKGGTQSVTFKDLFASQQSAPEYSKPYTLTITSEKVPGEHNLTNNVNTYTVFFTLTS